MDIFEAFKKRYSHKDGFLPDAVPLADLERIAQAGLDAPSGRNRQTVRLIILPNRAAIEPVCAVSPTIGLETTPAAIAVLTDKTLTPENEFNFEKEDYSAATENMLLAATALGYSSLWLDSPYFDREKEKQARAVLSVPEAYRLWAVLPIGKPNGEGSRREKLPFEERVYYQYFLSNPR
ncbi:MAG: nitroreductase family protein [Clostridiales bacterium]|jgi:nitroreductase|nr:nitroreductase family protein [Clostridiales bacterium]